MARGFARQGVPGGCGVFLTPDELYRLTGKRRYTAQRKVLDRRKIRYIRAESGEPLVESVSLDVKPVPARNREPRWDRL